MTVASDCYSALECVKVLMAPKAIVSGCTAIPVGASGQVAEPGLLLVPTG